MVLKQKTHAMREYFGSPGKTRTYNPQVFSRMLCHPATEKYLESGDYLLSQLVAKQVPSTFKGLTSV